MNAHTDYIYATTTGWASAVQGEFDKARDYWEYAQKLSPMIGAGDLAIDQCMLRFKKGEAEGVVQNCQPSEDKVIGSHFDDDITESRFLRGMKLTGTDFNMENYITTPCHHRENIKKDLPHVFVLSTGRCGTVSLYRLFDQSQYIPYHSYHFNISGAGRFEMMCGHVEGKYDSDVGYCWAATRAAEWLGCISVDQPMIALNHIDTIFAPTFAALHPNSKFIYLRREPKDVFKSFYSKNQWNLQQLQPINYSFTPDFNWRRASQDVPYSIAWYLNFTEKFSREFGRIMGDRFIEIASEDLFAGDVDKLIDFTEIDRPKSEVEQHFQVKHNEKIHKATPYDPEIFEKANSQVLNDTS